MNIIELAKQAGFFIKDNEAYSPSNQADHELTEFLEHFAALVEAQEREACADIAENWRSNGSPRVGVAEQIRARGTT